MVHGEADHTADEAEVAQVLIVDARVGVGLERHAFRAVDEEGKVGVDNILCEKLEPFSHETTGVNTFLALELDLNGAQEVAGVAVPEGDETLREAAGACHVHGHLGAAVAEAVKLVAELLHFEVEVQQTRRPHHETQLAVEHLAVPEDDGVDAGLVRLGEVENGSGELFDFVAGCD